MCEHQNKVLESGHCICVDCGLTLGIHLDSCEVTYKDSINRQFVQVYSRKDRFHRLLCNLRGWQIVPHNIMKSCDRSFRTVFELKKHIFSCKTLKKHIGKISTIWRQLGHQFEPPSSRDFQRALYEFDNYKGKMSFVLLLPLILQKIGREDLCKFCKQPSQLLQKKYALYVNEADWNESRGLGGKSYKDRIRAYQRQIHAEQTRKGGEQSQKFGQPKKHRTIEGISV